MANAIGDVASDLRALADELDVVLIVVSQLNRGVESRDNKRPHDVRFKRVWPPGGSCRHDLNCFTAMDITRPWGDEMDNICEIIVGKNRQGGGGRQNTPSLLRQAIHGSFVI